MSSYEIPSEAVLLERARALVPALRERADECERLRHIPPQSIQDMKDAGLFRVLQPRAFGGYEMDFSTYVKLSIELGRGCTSTAWVYENNAMHNLILAFFSEEAQREVWGEGGWQDDPPLISTGWSPKRGIAVREEGGYRLDGQWELASGSMNCSWDILNVPVVGEGNEFIEQRLFLLSKKAGEYEVLDTWHSMGLCGTGSNDIRVDKLFVSEYRTLSNADANRLDGKVQLQGYGVHDSVWHRVGTNDWMPWTVLPAMIGAARYGLEAEIERLKSRKNLFGEFLGDTQSVQLRIADAAARIDAAELLTMRGVSETARLYGKWECPSDEERATWRRDIAFGAQLVLEAVTSLVYRGGAHGIRDESVLQRVYRDVAAGSTHVGTDWDMMGRFYGMVVQGIPVEHPTFRTTGT